MATTTAVGFDANFTTLAGYNGAYFAWDAEFSQPVTETTPYGSSFRTYRGGVMGGTFNVEGQYKFDAATHAPMPDSTDTLNLTRVPGAITLTAATACSLSGSALIESTRMSNNMRTNDTSLQQSGRFSDTITQTWDES